MKNDILVYCVGGFFNRYKAFIRDDYNIVGYIDARFASEFNHNNEYSRIEDVICAYDRILVMTERPSVIYQVLRNLKQSGVSAEKIFLGISYYGGVAKYFSFSVLSDYSVAVIDANETRIANSEINFISNLKYMIEINVDYQAALLKRNIQSLYEDKLKIMWMDGHVSCADHEIDAYYRFEKDGSFGWGYTAVFSMMAINHFDNPYVLDLGCGDGYFFNHFFKYIDQIHYVGCDIDQHNIDRAIQKVVMSDCDVRFVNKDMVYSMPEPSFKSGFDVILWLGSFSVFEDEQRSMILQQIKKRIGTQGVVVLIDYYSKRETPSWECSINPVNDTKRIKELFQKDYSNVFLYSSEKTKSFVIMASNGKLPFE